MSLGDDVSTCDFQHGGVVADVASSLQDPKYRIDFHPAESPVLPVCFRFPVFVFLSYVLNRDIGWAICTHCVEIVHDGTKRNPKALQDGM